MATMGAQANFAPEPMASYACCLLSFRPMPTPEWKWERWAKPSPLLAEGWRRHPAKVSARTWQLSAGKRRCPSPGSDSPQRPVWLSRILLSSPAMLQCYQYSCNHNSSLPFFPEEPSSSATHSHDKLRSKSYKTHCTFSRDSHTCLCFFVEHWYYFLRN